MSRTSRLERFGHLPVLDAATSILPAPQLALWPSLGDIPEDFVLYGGTALALHLGHRASADFDFFSAGPFRPTELMAALRWLGRPTIHEAEPDNLAFSTPAGVRFSFFGTMEIQAVAEPNVVDANGLVIASVFDLAGTKAKALLDRSEWKDYVDIATLLRAGHRLPEILGYAAAIFEPLFAFPDAVFLRSLVYFEEGTAPDVPPDVRRDLERAVRDAWNEPRIVVEPWARTIAP